MNTGESTSRSIEGYGRFSEGSHGCEGGLEIVPGHCWKPWDHKTDHGTICQGTNPLRLHSDTEFRGLAEHMLMIRTLLMPLVPDMQTIPRRSGVSMDRSVEDLSVGGDSRKARQL